MAARAAAQACAFFLARLSEEVARLRQTPFPGHEVEPRRWLDLVEGLIKTGQSLLEQSFATNDSDLADRLIVRAERAGEASYDALSEVLGATAAHIPHQVVAPLRRWVRKLNISNTLFFRAAHLPNYEFESHDRLIISGQRPPHPLLQTAADAISWPLLVVTVPSQAMGMLPHFAVVAHELGHAIEARIDLEPALAFANATEDNCYENLKKRLDSLGLDFTGDIDSKTRKAVSDWISEVKSDAIGLELAGPAFFLAQCAYLELTNRGYGVSPTHPPSDFRRRLMFAALSEGRHSHVDAFRAGTKGLQLTETINSGHVSKCPDNRQQLFDELSLEHLPEDAAFCVEFIPYIQEIGEAIYAGTRDYLAKTSPALRYTPEQLEADLVRHLELLELDVPPIEYFDETGKAQAADLTSILNVGWAALLREAEKKQTDAEAANEAMHLHGLLLRAVELSEARVLWEENNVGSVDGKGSRTSPGARPAEAIGDKSAAGRG